MAMKGIDNIAQRIIADAEAKAAEILQEARDRANTIEENSRVKTQQELEQARADAKERGEENLRRSERTAQLESKKAQLAARQQMIDQVYETALAQLLALDETQYTSLLCGLCQKAVAQGGGEVLLNQKDRERCGQKVVDQVAQATGAQLTLSQETVEIPGGFILRQGKVEINCALDAVVRSLADHTAKGVAAILF